jgi:hypothetical protein
MQPNIFKSALHNFHIVGLLLSLKFILTAQKYGIFASFAIIISILLVFVLYLMSVHFRDTECKGTIKYGQAFLYIFLIYFFGSIVSSIVMIIYTSYIDTNYLGSLLDVMLKLYDSIKMPIADKYTTVLQSLYKPVPFSLLNVFSSVFSAAFWGLILAAFVRREKSLFKE